MAVFGDVDTNRGLAAADERTRKKVAKMGGEARVKKSRRGRSGSNR